MSKIAEMQLAEGKANEYFAHGEYQWAKMWYSQAKAVADDLGKEDMAEQYFSKMRECDNGLTENRQQFLQD